VPYPGEKKNFMITEEQIKKANQIYAWLNTMESGTKFDIERYYQGEEKVFLIEIVKEYIDINENGKLIGFSSDYRYIKKI
jgi:hypothetical protein